MHVFTGVEPALVRAPANTAVTQGSYVTLDCTSSSDVGTQNSELPWFNSLCPSYDIHCIRCCRIYNGVSSGSTPPRFSVTSTTNATQVTRDLNISPTKMTDAGVYVCVENIYDPDFQQTASSAQLVILGNLQLIVPIVCASLQGCNAARTID